MKKILYLIVVSFLLFHGKSIAQNIVADSTYGENGFAHAGPEISSQFGSLVIQPDGKSICVQRVGGSSLYDILLCRFKANGEPDSTFGVNGVALTITTLSETPHCMDLQADGKIVVGSLGVKGIVSRYKTNGSPDSTFALTGTMQIIIPGDMAGSIYGLYEMADGKILAGGNTSTGANQYGFVARIKPNGTLDSTFAVNGIAKGPLYTVFSMAVQDDGKILLGGRGSTMGFFRLKANGVVDSIFGTNGISNAVYGTALSYANKTFINNDGSIIGAGTYQTASVLHSQFMTFKVDSNGVPDNSYGLNAIGIDSLPGMYSSIPNEAAMQPDEKIIMSCALRPDQATDYRFCMMRFNANGTVDTAFGDNGVVIAYQGNEAYSDAIAIQDDGNILLGGGVVYDTAADERILTVARFKAAAEGPTGFNQVINNEFLKVYPNPAHNMLTVNWKNRSGSVKTFVKLTDINGRIVELLVDDNNTAEKSFNIYLEKVSTGIFFLTVSDGISQQTLPVIKE